MDSAAIVTKRGEMLFKALNLVLLTAAGVLVVQAKRGISAMLAMLFGLLGLVQTRHNESS